MKLVIDRSQWGRGRGEGVLLDRDDRSMCCLGFLACTLGAARSTILDAYCPMEVREVPWPKWMLTFQTSDDISGDRWVDSSAAEALMGANDSMDIDDATREEFIRQAFAHYSGGEIEVVFVDGPAEAP